MSAVGVVTKPAPSISAVVTIANGLTAKILQIKKIAGQARGPGEVAGPSVAVTVLITNHTSHVIPLEMVQVTAGDAAQTPAEPLSGAPAKPVAGKLQPGQSTTGIYVFVIPTKVKNPLTIAVSYSAGPVVLFTTSA